jgi:ABC-type lipoprotein release transport system permease subunit
MAQAVEQLLCKHKDPSSNPRLTKKKKKEEKKPFYNTTSKNYIFSDFYRTLHVENRTKPAKYV